MMCAEEAKGSGGESAIYKHAHRIRGKGQGKKLRKSLEREGFQDVLYIHQKSSKICSKKWLFSLLEVK